MKENSKNGVSDLTWVAAVDLDKMVAACLADDDLGDDLEEDDDPDLLNELAELEITGQDDDDKVWLPTQFFSVFFFFTSLICQVRSN